MQVLEELVLRLNLGFEGGDVPRLGPVLAPGRGLGPQELVEELHLLIRGQSPLLSRCRRRGHLGGGSSGRECELRGRALGGGGGPTHAHDPVTSLREPALAGLRSVGLPLRGWRGAGQVLEVPGRLHHAAGSHGCASDQPEDRGRLRSLAPVAAPAAAAAPGVGGRSLLVPPL